MFTDVTSVAKVRVCMLNYNMSREALLLICASRMPIHQFAAFVAYLTLSIEGQADWLSSNSMTEHVQYCASRINCKVHAFCCVYLAAQVDAVGIWLQQGLVLMCCR